MAYVPRDVHIQPDDTFRHSTVRKGRPDQFQCVHIEQPDREEVILFFPSDGDVARSKINLLIDALIAARDAIDGITTGV